MLETRNRCRHIRPSGHRCASPALRNEHFCYYHHETRGAVLKREAQDRAGRQSTCTLLEPDDRTAIQLNLGEIIRRLSANEIDPRRAGLLLYALQIASSNLPKPPVSREPAQTAQTIDEIIEDETYGPLAPACKFQSARREKGLEQILLEQWARDEEKEARERAEQAAQGKELRGVELLQSLNLQACTEQSSQLTADSSKLKNNPTPPITLQAVACATRLSSRNGTNPQRPSYPYRHDDDPNGDATIRSQDGGRRLPQLHRLHDVQHDSLRSRNLRR